MGYTHAKTLFQANADILANGHGTYGTKPSVTWRQISFNGNGRNASHETCFISKSKYKGFNFCKTARKEYDKIVVALLTYINHIAPDALEIGSDGSDEPYMFEEGLKLAQKHSGIQEIKSLITIWPVKFHG